MRRAIGMDNRRTFVEVVIWEDGRLPRAGRVGANGFGGIRQEPKNAQDIFERLWEEGIFHCHVGR